MLGSDGLGPLRRLGLAARAVGAGRGGRAAVAQTLLARGTILAVNLATGVVTARVLGAEGRGEQAALLVCLGFSAGLLTLGLPSATVFNVRSHREDRRRLVGAALAMGVGLGVLAAALAATAVPFVLSSYDEEVRRTAQLLAMAAALYLLTPICAASLEADGDFLGSNAARVLNPSLTLAALLALAAAGLLTPLSAALAYVLAGPPLLAFLLVRIRRRHGPVLAGFRRAAARLLSFGLRSYGIDILNTLSLHIDKILVVGFLSAAQAGSYVVAVSAARLMSIVQISVVTVLFPKAAGRPQAEVVEFVGHTARFVLACTVVAGAGLIAGGPLLLGVVYGEEFTRAALLFQLLVAEVVLAGLVVVLAQTFMAVGRPGVVTCGQLVGVALAVPLMVVAIPVLGLEGAGVALLSATAARLAFVLAAYPIVLGVAPPSLLPGPSDFAFALNGRRRNADR